MNGQVTSLMTRLQRGVVEDGGRLGQPPGAALPGCLRSASSSPWAAASWALVSASSRRSSVSLVVRVATTLVAAWLPGSPGDAFRAGAG
jgi:hypothetical protein